MKLHEYFASADLGDCIHPRIRPLNGRWRAVVMTLKELKQIVYKQQDRRTQHYTERSY